MATTLEFAAGGYRFIPGPIPILRESGCIAWILRYTGTYLSDLSKIWGLGRHTLWLSCQNPTR